MCDKTRLETALEAALAKLDEATKMIAYERQENRRLQTINDHLLTGTEPAYWVCHCGGGDIEPAPDCNPNEDGTVCIDCGRTGQWTKEAKP